MVQHLSSMRQTLSSIPSTKKEKGKEGRRRKEKEREKEKEEEEEKKGRKREKGRRNERGQALCHTEIFTILPIM